MPEFFLRLEELTVLLIFIQRNYQGFLSLLEPGDIRGGFFVQNLESENCLVVPPVSLIARSLQKARATIVIPVWPSSSFWHLMQVNISSL